MVDEDEADKDAMLIGEKLKNLLLALELLTKNASNTCFLVLNLIQNIDEKSLRIVMNSG
jgi:hypothetical protein